MNDIHPRSRGSAAMRGLTVAAVLATYALVVVGGLVRASESGLGCPDWPLCKGQAIPLAQLQGATLIEYSHRLVTTVVTLLIIATALMAWRYYRHERWVFRPAILAAGLLVVQILLGGITVLLELPPAVVGTHLANALLIFASLITTAMFVWRPWPEPSGRPSGRDRLPGLALASLVGSFILVVSGTIVTGTEAEEACTTWPLCNGQLLPAGGSPASIAMLHRFVAGAIGLLILYTLLQAWRTRHSIPNMARATLAVAALLLAQMAIGGVLVALDFAAAADVLHLALAAAFWASVVVFTIMSYQTAPQAQTIGAAAKPGAAGAGDQATAPMRSSDLSDRPATGNDVAASGDAAAAALVSAAGVAHAQCAVALCHCRSQRARGGRLLFFAH